jgi:hypothetical protein
VMVVRVLLEARNMILVQVLPREASNVVVVQMLLQARNVMLVQKLLEAFKVMLALTVGLTVLQVSVTVTAQYCDEGTRLPHQLRAYRITAYHQKKS